MPATSLKACPHLYRENSTVFITGFLLKQYIKLPFSRFLSFKKGQGPAISYQTTVIKSKVAPEFLSLTTYAHFTRVQKSTEFFIAKMQHTNLYLHQYIYLLIKQSNAADTLSFTNCRLIRYNVVSRALS